MKKIVGEMKKILSVLCFLTLLFTSIAVLAEGEEADDRVPDYTHSQFAGKVGQWGPFKNNNDDPGEGPTYTKVDSEAGTETDIKIVGGKSEGGYIFSFNDGGMASGTHGPSKEYRGAIDASSITINYKSNRGVKVAFRSEYRLNPTITYDSKEVALPSTNGEFQSYTIPLSDFKRADESKGTNGNWIYAMEGKYVTTNFNPVITFNVRGINNSTEIQFHEFTFNWFQADMVSSATIHDQKINYWQNRDDFDFTQGSITLVRGGESEEIPLNDRRVEIKGYNKTKTGSQKITVTTYNKTITYNVNVKPYLPDNLEKIEVINPKTDYLELEDFAYETGVVKATYDDGTTEEVALNHPNVSVTGFDSSVPAASQNISVTYGGKTVVYSIAINKFEVQDGITLKGVRRLYKVGDKFDWHAGEIIPGQGTPGKIFSKYAQISGFDSSAAAEDQVITVTYGGQTTTYTIDIIEEDLPVRYAIQQNMEKTQCWKWGNQMHHFGSVAGAAENGIDSAIYIQGDGTHGGGGAVVFTDGAFGGGNNTMSDGTVLSGFIGADAMRINYKNTFTPSRASNYPQYTPTFNFKIEYKNSTVGKNKDSGKYKLPVTKDDPNDADEPGYWVHDFIIPLSTFDGTDKTQATAESIDWLYNMKSAFVADNFNPSVQWRLNGKLLDGDELYFDKIEFVWFEDEPVESITVENPKTTYKPGESFNTSTGRLNIKYKGKNEIRVTDLNEVKVTGFDSNAGEKMQTVTLSYAGKTASFDVNFGEPMIADPTMYKKNGETFEPIDTFTIGDTYKYGVTISGDLVKENTDIIICAIAYDQEGQILDRISEIPMTITPETEKQLVETAEFTAEENVAYKFFIIDKNSLTPYLDHAICNQVMTAK